MKAVKPARCVYTKNLICDFSNCEQPCTIPRLLKAPIGRQNLIRSVGMHCQRRFLGVARGARPPCENSGPPVPP